MIFFFLFTSGDYAISGESAQPNCVSLALDMFDAYYDNGYTYAESYQAMNWAYEGCVSDGGYAGEQ